MVRVLVVEDEPAVSQFIRQSLEEAGYEVGISENMADADTVARNREPDLVLLDRMLPDGDGIEWLRRFRTDSDVPVMLLTAKDSLGDRVHGLDAGADDYIGKPFQLEELLARIRALTRRRRREEPHFEYAGLSIDYLTRLVRFSGKQIYLSTTEYELLEMLTRTQGSLVSKLEVLRQIWGDEQRDPNVVEVYVNYIRHKLGRAGAPKLIHTVRGKGYVLATEPPD
jgi:DNA-binding response OmpR family regulator